MPTDLDALERLASLRDRGVLNEHEYQEQKQALLGRSRPNRQSTVPSGLVALVALGIAVLAVSVWALTRAPSRGVVYSGSAPPAEALAPTVSAAPAAPAPVARPSPPPRPPPSRPRISNDDVEADLIGHNVDVYHAGGTRDPISWTFDASELRSVSIQSSSGDRQTRRMEAYVSTASLPNARPSFTLNGLVAVNYTWNGAQWDLWGIENLGLTYVRNKTGIL